MPETPEPEKRTWRSRNVLALGVVSFFTDVHSETILALLPQFMANVLGLPMSVIGAIEGIAEATASGLKIASGWFSDRIGKRKPLILAGYALSTLVKPLLALAQFGWHVLAVRIADRIGKGIRTSSRDALMAESVSAEHRGRAFGFHRAMDTAGAVVGTLLAMGLLVLFLGDYRRVFWVAAIAGVAAVFTIIAGVRERPRRETAEEKGKPKAALAGSLPLFLVAHTIFSAGNFSYAFFLLRAQDVGVREELVPALYLLHNVVYALAAFPSGALLDRVGARAAQAIAYLWHTVACVGFAAFAGPELMPLWIAVYGLQLGATSACSRATVAGLLKAGKHGMGMGVFHACQGGGLLVAGIVGGLLWDRLGLAAAPFYYGAGMALIAALLVWPALRAPAGDQPSDSEATGEPQP